MAHSRRLAGMRSWIAVRRERITPFLPAFGVLANVATVVSVVVAILVVRPTLVRLVPEPRPSLTGFVGHQSVLDDDYARAIVSPAWIEGYVANNGTALATDLALEVTLDEPVDSPVGKWVTSLLRGVVGSVNDSTLGGMSVWKLAEGPWTEYNLARIAGWARLYLPPLPPGSFVCVTVTVPESYVGRPDATFMRILESGATVRLVDLTTHVRSYYVAPGSEDPGGPHVVQEIAVPFWRYLR